MSINLCIAKAIKDLSQWGKAWELSFIIALVIDLSSDKNDPKQVSSCYENLYKYIYERNLDEVFNLKSHLDVSVC